MTGDVVLTAALRNNLLSLQNTQGLIDTTQLRLATGRKVNSALDNPQSFFAAQALSNRAGDLSRLLDGLGQSIQVIKAADNGVTALTKLVEQADSVAQGARDAIAQGQVEAKVTGSRDMRGINDLTGLPGITTAGGDTLTFSITDENGNAIQIAPYGGLLAATSTVTITQNMSTEDLLTAINDIQISDLATPAPAATGGQAFEATLNESGQIQIKTLNGGDFTVNFVSVAATDPANLALAADLGFADVARLVPDGGAGTSNVEFSAVADVALRSFPLYNNSVPPSIAPASTTLDNIVDDTGAINRFANLDNADDDYTISINGSAAQSIDLTDAAGNPLTIQSFVDQINNNTSLNTKIRASYDDTTGALEIRPIDSTVESIEIGISSGSGATANFGFGINTDLTDAGGQPETETIRLAAAAADLAQFETDYNNLRQQITELVGNGDTGYRGTNLLNGDNLFTVFNEFRTSTLTTQGVTFTADGLGLDEANFARIDSIEGSLTQVREALEAVRGFGLTLANDLSIIQARENFTKDIVNTLKEGSDKLTVADQNEEGAKLLALQTRQQLGVTSLSLASQSQQSILRLF